jgi:hypothetical protein
VSARPTILALASYFKGQEFLREAKRLGARVLLLTREKLKDAEWPMESLDERFLMPDLHRRDDVIHAVSYMARSEAIDRIGEIRISRDLLLSEVYPLLLCHGRARLTARVDGHCSSASSTDDATAS